MAPQSDGIVVTKHRISAFAGTDLDVILRANDLDPNLRACLTGKLFPRTARVTKAREFTAPEPCC